MTLETKIISFDPINGNVIVKFRNSSSLKPIDSYPEFSYAVAATTEAEVIEILQAQGAAVAAQQDAIDAASSNQEHTQFFKNMVGTTYTV